MSPLDVILVVCILFHLFAAVPKLNAWSASGIILELMSEPKVVESVSASPNLIEPLRVKSPFTVNLSDINS